jgi:hypothetical protein
MTKFYFLLISLYFLLVVYMSPAVNAPFLMALALTGASSKTTTLKINTPNRVSSCTMPVSISADYCTNAGFVKLTANSTGTVSSYLWSTGQSTQTILVDVANDYSVSLTNSSGCVGTAVISIGQELVINGNFTEGNTGFSSDYTYYPDVAGNNELVNDQGTNGYGVGTNGQNYHPGFWGIDHTNNQTGNKNFMLVNGHGNTLTIWKETVNVLPNTDYYFSAWAMSLNNVGPYARLQFEVNGVKVGTIDTLVAGPSTTSQAAANNYWTRFYSSPKWNSGSITKLQRQEMILVWMIYHLQRSRHSLAAPGWRVQIPRMFALKQRYNLLPIKLGQEALVRWLPVCRMVLIIHSMS